MPQTIVPTKHRSKKGVTTWRVKFRFGGSDRTRSLGQMSKQEADVLAAKIGYTLNRLEQGSLSIPEGMDAITFILSGGESRQTRQASRQTLGALREAYLDAQRQSVGETTLGEYKTRLGALCRILGEGKLLDDLTFSDLEKFVRKRHEECEGGTVRRDVVRFFGAYKLAVAKGWVSADRKLDRDTCLDNLTFAKSKKKPKFRTLTETMAYVLKKKPEGDELRDVWHRCYLDEKQLGLFIDSLESVECPRWLRVMVMTAIYTGARRTELCDLDVTDVERDTIILSQRKAHHKKHSGSEREVPVAPQLAEYLDPWLADHPGGKSLFYVEGQLARSRNKATGYRRITKDIATDQLKRVVGRMGVFSAIAGRWHIFRHSFISACAVKGIPKDRVKAMVGHLTMKSATTTRT